MTNKFKTGNFVKYLGDDEDYKIFWSKGDLTQSVGPSGLKRPVSDSVDANTDYIIENIKTGKLIPVTETLLTLP